MASVAFSAERVAHALEDVGFYFEDDESAGIAVTQMKQAFLSAAGLEFYKANFLHDTRIRSSLELMLPRCSLARYRRFQADPGHIFQYRAGGERSGPGVIVVQLWAGESRVVYYYRSHKYALAGAKASNGLWEIPSAALEDAGCGEFLEVHFPHGGLTIQDARVAFSIETGTPIATVFAKRDIIARWTRMVAPNTPDVIQKVQEIQEESSHVGLHIQFEGACGNV